MKKNNLGLLGGAAAIIGAAAWYLNSGAGDPAHAPKAAQAQAPTVVSLVSPHKQDVPVLLQANGTVSPLASVDLHPQTASTIAKVHIKEGQFVKQGQLMFSLDARNEHANMDKAQAQLARDQSAVSEAERQYRRAQELFSQHFIAQSQVDTLKSARDAALALVAADVAAAKSAQVAASYMTISAPMAGRVGAINVYAGSLVQMATSLTTITQLDPINVAFNLPEAALGDLLAAQKRGPVAVEAQAGEGAKVLKGALSFIDNTVDPTVGAIRVKAQFDNHEASLWPGQYVNTRLTVQLLKDAIVVPQAAIISNTRGTFVYTAQADQTVKQTNVVRVHSFGLMAVVTGLRGDEKIVTEGKQNLRPGAKIKAQDAKGAAS